MELDVAIIGGGLSGNALARQLRRTVPELRVGVIERDAGTSYRVGESTVEMATNYLVRRLGLGRYLHEHHVPKNGLRFFFDTAERDAELHRMTEIGTRAFPFHPAFQLDRSRIDADLRRLNEEGGVEMLAGAKARNIELADDGGLHRFVCDRDRGETVCRARWIVDATGRTRLVQKSLAMDKLDVGLSNMAVWGRLRNVADIDDRGPESWRARVRHTSRFSSTNHFCYPGYWIWFIPLGNGVMSVGVVGQRDVFTPEMRHQAGFLEFLRRHRAVGELLAGAEVIDVLSFGQLAYGTERYFGPNRWGLIGDAAAFSDPLYSPGSDFMALENDFLTDLIQREAAGEDIARRTQLYDDFMRFRFEANMRLYRELYPLLGSFRVLKLKWDFDIASYYNLWLHPYMLDLHLDVEWLEDQLAQREYVLTALTNFTRLFKRVEAHERDAGSYFAANLDRYSAGLENVDFVEQVGGPRTRKQVLRKTGEFFNGVRERALELLDLPSRGEPLPLFEFLLDRSLA